jgi:hypothetical protein
MTDTTKQKEKASLAVTYGVDDHGHWWWFEAQYTDAQIMNKSVDGHGPFLSREAAKSDFRATINKIIENVGG